MKEITAKELKSKVDSGETVQIIDIREIYEVDSGNIGGLHIPMAEIMSRISDVKRDCIVVIHCKSGNRAKAIIHALQTQKGFDNLYNLKGGLLAWNLEVDQTIMVY